MLIRTFLILFACTILGCAKHKIKNRCCENSTITITPSDYKTEPMTTGPAPYDTASFTVTIFAPNLFTPDGDGLNEYFKLEGQGFTYSKITVKKGIKKIYTNTDFTDWRGWNATNDKGKEVDDGVYKYEIELTTMYDEEVTVEGEVCLVREQYDLENCEGCIAGDQIDDLLGPTYYTREIGCY